MISATSNPVTDEPSRSGDRGRSALQRGKDAIRRIAGPSKQDLWTELGAANAEIRRRHAEDEAALQHQLDQARAELTEANSEVERLRALVHKERRLVERWKKELGATRNSLWDPLPGLEVPERVTSVIERVRAERLSYLEAPHLAVLARQVMDADRSGREGLIIEAGTARGGSAIAMAAAKEPSRKMLVYDVFGQIPEPSEEDGKDVLKRYETITAGEAKGVGGDTYYGYRDDLYAEVTQSFADCGVPVAENTVELVQGLFEDTIEIDEPVAFAHIDGDWYESTLTCLERIAPHLVPGGRLVLDDYFHWSGCRKAVDQYFDGRPGFQLERRKKIHVVKL